MAYEAPIKNIDIGNSYKDDRQAKEPIYRSGKHGYYFAVFRIGKKYKQLHQVQGFQKHMQREMEVPNADHLKTHENQILIGNSDIFEDVQSYIQDVKLRTNSVIARELLLTASPDFFKNIPEEQRIMWVNKNVNWLKDNFGDNVRYAVLHRDESTWHIHCLIVPKFTENNKTFLSNTRYFDGPAKLRAWQDNYANAMQSTFKSLNRGIRNSKAKHIEVRHFYGIINSVRSMENSEEIFKHDILLKAKIKALESTLSAYKQLVEKEERSVLEVNKLNIELSKQVKELKKDKDTYKDVVKELSQRYKLPQNAIEKVIKYCQNKELER
jgi:hypothetical protein